MRGRGRREEDKKCRNPFGCMTYREISQTPWALESGMRSAAHWKERGPIPICTGTRPHLQSFVGQGSEPQEEKSFCLKIARSR